MTVKDILEFVKSNSGKPEMITFLEGLKTLDHESVKDYLEKDESGKNMLKSLNDAAVTKGIATFKEKSLPGLIEDEIKKKFPAETEADKKLRTLEAEQQRLTAEIKKKDLQNKAISLATEKKLPLKLVDRFIGDDEETTIRNIELFEAEYGNSLKTAVESKFKEEGRTPPPNTPPPVDFSKMSDDEYFQTRLKDKKN